MTVRRLSSLTLPFAILCVHGLAQSGPLQLISLTPPSGSGNGQVFGLTVADSHGGADVSQVGIYIAANFDGADTTSACLAYYQRDTNRLFLAGDAAADWKSGVLNEGEPLAKRPVQLVLAGLASQLLGRPGYGSICDHVWRVIPGKQAGVRLCELLCQLAGHGMERGRQLDGDRGLSSGRRPARAAVAAAAGVDPNDLATKQLFKPTTSYDKFVTANVGVTALTHQQGQLRFLMPGGRKVALVGAVTHQDKQTGAWVPNAPVLSETNNGWRMDGTYNDLIIRKQGLDRHVLTQTYTDFSSKHDSVLTLTVPSLIYDKNLTFHFLQDGFTWNLAVDNGAAFDLSASVAKRAGAQEVYVCRGQFRAPEREPERRPGGRRQRDLEPSRHDPEERQAGAMQRVGLLFEGWSVVRLRRYRPQRQSASLSDRPLLAEFDQRGNIRRQLAVHRR